MVGSHFRKAFGGVFILFIIILFPIFHFPQRVHTRRSFSERLVHYVTSEVTQGWLSHKQLIRLSKIEKATNAALQVAPDRRHALIANARTLRDRLSQYRTPNTSSLLNECELRSISRGGDDSSIVYTTVSPLSPNGVLLAFHGCSHTSKDFCYPSISCPKCVGLPEEIRVVEAALQAGLRVIAITSENKQSHCWASGGVPSERSDELRNDDVRNVIRVLEKEGVLRSALPLIAFGASSGGGFAGLLSQAVLGESLIGVISQIMAPSVVGSAYWSPDTPIVFSLMSRDSGSIERAMRQVQSVGAAFQGELLLPDAGSVGVVSLKSRSPTASFLSSRIPAHPKYGPFTQEMGAAVIKALEADGILASDGVFRDPRGSKSWQGPVKRALKGTRWEGDTVTYDKSPIVEELNVAYGRHELFSDYFKESLAFVLNSFLNRRS